MKFGLIGYPLTHSFSKKYFESKFQSLDWSSFSYDNFPIEKIEDVVPMLSIHSFAQESIHGRDITPMPQGLSYPWKNG